MKIPERDWKKSSYSGNDDNCVEVAKLGDQAAVRDSKDPHGGELAVSGTAWQHAIATFVRE